MTCLNMAKPERFSAWVMEGHKDDKHGGPVSPPSGAQIGILRHASQRVLLSAGILVGAWHQHGPRTSYNGNNIKKIAMLATTPF